MDGLLGRHFVAHDEASRSYGVRPLMASRVVRKPTFWALPPGGYPLNQGAEGACTGYGVAHELAAGPVQIPSIDDAWARGFYDRVQATDRSMGNNFPSGATTLATMKTAKQEGIITGYRWAFGIDDVVDSLMIGPVCLGIEWRESMYETGPYGKVISRGRIVGGHFITAVAFDSHPKLGPVVGWINSWGNAYGVGDTRLGVSGGVGWISLPDLQAILSRNGEAVVPADFFQSAPQFFSYKQKFHSKHKGLKREREFSTRDEAVNAGFVPCRVCRP